MKFSNRPSTGAVNISTAFASMDVWRHCFRRGCPASPAFRFRRHDGERFRYEYDFTAGWALDVRLEQVLPWDAKRSVPVCTGGSRAAPPEDCDGALD